MHSQKENKSIEKDPRMTVMIKLAGKDFKIAVRNMLKNLKENMGVKSKEIEYIKHSKDNF